VYFIGLLSDGGVDTHISHLNAFCNAVKQANLQQNQVFIYAYIYVRDTYLKGVLGYRFELDNCLTTSNSIAASEIDRYYAIEGNNRWERVKETYDLLTKGVGTPVTDLKEAIKASYAEGITDEFIKPIIISDAEGKPLATIQDGDVVFCYNFR